MPKDKYYNGTEWEIMDANDSDTVDNLDLRVNEDVVVLTAQS